MKKSGKRMIFFNSGKKSAAMATFLLSLLFGLSFVLPVQAFQFDVGKNGKVNLDTTLTYSGAFRLKDPDSEHLADINTDDGNRAFEKGELYNNKVTILADLEFLMNNVGLFSRGKAFYDWAYTGRNSHDSPSTRNDFVGGDLNHHQDWSDKIEDMHRCDVELLDLYAFGDFYVSDRPLSIKVGRQVINWGESLFFMGGISSAQGHLDAIAATDAGVELKDLFLPSGAALVQIGLTDTIGFQGYYQWEWEKNRLPAAGSYWGYDWVDEGGKYFLAAPAFVFLTRGADEEAKDSGQFGLSLNFIVPALADTEFAIYYLNYHEKNFMLNLDFAGGDYSLAFQEDIPLYGASFSSVIGDTNVSGEVSYRDGLKLALADGSYKAFDVIQAQVSIMHIFGPVAFMDGVSLLWEGGYNKVLDAENLSKDSEAWAHKAKLNIDFFNIAPNLLPGLDLRVEPGVKHQPKGKSTVPNTFTEGRNELELGLKFTYKLDWEVKIAWKEFLGDPDDEGYSDRDYLSFYIKKSF